MKKIALTSLLAVFAAAGAQAANVIDGNPLYMPRAGHFYSISTLGSHSGSEEFKSWGLNEEFGYGITDRLGVMISTSLEDQRSFDSWEWSDMGLNLAFRALDKGAWKMDLIGGYEVDPVWGNHRPFLDKNDTIYTWTAGVRGGYTTSAFTVAGHALFTYENTESFNWNEKAGRQGNHRLVLGLDGQVALCDKMNLVAGVEYTGVMDDEWYGFPGAKVRNAGEWTGELGLNYNIDSTKFVGAYINGEMDHRGGVARDEWNVKNGFGYGVKFGIDF